MKKIPLGMNHPWLTHQVIQRLVERERQTISLQCLIPDLSREDAEKALDKFDYDELRWFVSLTGRIPESRGEIKDLDLDLAKTHIEAFGIDLNEGKKETIGDGMDNDMYLLVTLCDRDEEWPNLVKCAVTIKNGMEELPSALGLFWREPALITAINAALPEHVKSIGFIVAVEALFWIG